MKHNVRLIFIIQMIVWVVLCFYMISLETGYEKNVSKGVTIGFLISLVIQLLIFRIRPVLYGNKTS